MVSAVRSTRFYNLIRGNALLILHLLDASPIFSLICCTIVLYFDTKTSPIEPSQLLEAGNV